MQPRTPPPYQPQPYPGQSAPARPKRALVREVWSGAVLGDFDQEKGALAAVVQSALGYVPFVGTASALRDIVADLQQRDGLGVVLNVLAALPIAGGLAKTADAIHTLHRINQTRARKQAGVFTTPAPPQRASGWRAFWVSLFVMAGALLFGFGARILTEYLWRFGPDVQGFALHGYGALVTPVITLPVGFAIGLVVSVSNRAWLGLLLLPFLLAIGFSFYLSGVFF